MNYYIRNNSAKIYGKNPRLNLYLEKVKYVFPLFICISCLSGNVKPLKQRYTIRKPESSLLTGGFLFLFSVSAV